MAHSYSVGDVLFFKEEVWRREHLFVVATDPSSNEGGLMLFPCVVSADGFTGEVTCRIVVGDHPFITHESVIDYRRTMTVTATDLDSMVAEGLARLSKHAMGSEAVARIIEGGRTSKHLDKDKKRLLPPESPSNI